MSDNTPILISDYPFLHLLLWSTLTVGMDTLSQASKDLAWTEIGDRSLKLIDVEDVSAVESLEEYIGSASLVNLLQAILNNDNHKPVSSDEALLLKIVSEFREGVLEL